MLAARGRLRLMADVDLSMPMTEVPKLTEAVEGGADIAIASRAMPDSVLPVRESPGREAIGRWFNGLARIIALPRIRDTQCGFKLFRGDASDAVFRRQRLNRFAFDVEILWLALRLGLRVAEVGVLWRHDERSRVHPVRDGIRMGSDLVRILVRRTLGD